ncbi:MAG: uracil-DNA glycosylase [Rhodospirillales bacterium RIFCSPLOWO2_12_FULL_58_28]|nr:MAG: uracil-DNA glycosylase [Rhodospirillales bacterium RIFCSPLOWO2_02_FULL_58_16]OHC78988.1 MAG: uracil-DNA glycosylase [Rhodospirillales bacterium RIFCSPLOWO2_12_FULL_58_28]
MNNRSLPASDCNRCPRLAAFRHVNRAAFPDKFNAPVPSFGDLNSSLLIVGLAPGLKGANFSGRPFTGDYAGDLLYAALDRYGLSEGTYGADAGDGLRLVNTRITNAVRCVPPANKPVAAEAAQCRPFLADEIESMGELRVILALGVLAHDAVLAALRIRKSLFRFRHGAFHRLTERPVMADSYHCSRYNTNTGKLTEAMFYSVFDEITRML